MAVVVRLLLQRLLPRLSRSRAVAPLVYSSPPLLPGATPPGASFIQASPPPPPPPQVVAAQSPRPGPVLVYHTTTMPPPVCFCFLAWLTCSLAWFRGTARTFCCYLQVGSIRAPSEVQNAQQIIRQFICRIHIPSFARYTKMFFISIRMAWTAFPQRCTFTLGGGTELYYPPLPLNAAHR